MEEIVIPRELLLKEFEEFTPWSGRHLVRLMGMKDSKMVPLGSGGMLKYKDRYFVLTNAHVIRGIDKNDIRIPYTINDSVTYSMTILDVKFSLSDDLAALEIRFSEKINESNHEFLDSIYIETNIEEYIARTNILYLHGYPYGGTTIDDEKKEIEAVTFPFCTFVDKYDTYIGSVFAFIDDEGTSEFNTTINIPVVAGMSGSFVYGYYYLEEPKYKLIGILTNWHIVEGRLEIFPIVEFLNYIDNNFFQNM